MTYTINELREKLYEKVYTVYDIFKNFFTPEHVDLQGMPANDTIRNAARNFRNGQEETYNVEDADIETIRRNIPLPNPKIYVWWPSVVVTNENDRSVVISDLYARIDLLKSGTIPYESHGFYMTRSSFTQTQYDSGYCHSHLPTIHDHEQLPEFERPCLGRGPIANTIMALKNDFDESMWMLFCQELSMYVTVESLSGGPYIRMETIGSYNSLNTHRGYIFDINAPSSFNVADKRMYRETLKDFIKWYLKYGNLSFNYSYGKFIPGMDYFNYAVDVSNSFIEWANANMTEEEITKFYDKGILITAKVSQGKFYKSLSTRHNNPRTSLEGRTMFNFKGHPVTFHVDRSEEEENQNFNVTLLSEKMAAFVLNTILLAINYNYGRREEETSGADKTIRFI